MKTIRAKAGQATKILSKFSNSISTNYSFSASAVTDENDVSGSIEVKGSNWIFPKPSTIQPLKANNTVTKTMWDVFFSVHITPNQDVNVELEGGQMKWPLLIAVLVVGIVGAAAAIMIVGTE